MSKDKPLYSTAKPPEKPGSQKKSAKLKMRLESKGRAGKSVTVLFNLPFDTSTAEKLLSELKSKMGCGGTFKNGMIELQGDVRTKLAPVLTAKGFEVVSAGG